MNGKLLHGPRDRRGERLRIDLLRNFLDVMRKPVGLALGFGQLAESRALELGGGLPPCLDDCRDARRRLAQARPLDDQLLLLLDQELDHLQILES